MSKLFPPPSMKEPRSKSAVDDRETRDAARGYSINFKQITLAFVIEGVVIGLSLIAALLFAEQFGRDGTTKAMMMLAPVAYAVAEVSRVPLAIATRVQPAFLMRMLALVAVLCAAGITTKSMSQLGEIMFRPRLLDVVERRADLAAIKSKMAVVGQNIHESDQNLNRSQNDLSAAQARATSASSDVSKLPPVACVPVATKRKSGRVVRTTSCLADPRNASMTGNLVDAGAAVVAARRELEVARKARAQLDPTMAAAAVTTAEVLYRKALFNSQLHSFTGMLFGKDVAEVTDGEVNSFLRIFVFVPAILVSLSSTFLAMTAVVRIKHPAAKVVEIPDEGLIKLLTPMRDDIIRSAANEVAKEVRGKFARADKSDIGSADRTSTVNSADMPVAGANSSKATEDV